MWEVKEGLDCFVAFENSFTLGTEMLLRCGSHSLFVGNSNPKRSFAEICCYTSKLTIYDGSLTFP